MHFSQPEVYSQASHVEQGLCWTQAKAMFVEGDSKTGNAEHSLFSTNNVQTFHTDFFFIITSFKAISLLELVQLHWGRNTFFDVMTDVVSSTFVQEVFTARGRCKIHTLTPKYINRWRGQGVQTQWHRARKNPFTMLFDSQTHTGR